MKISEAIRIGAATGMPACKWALFSRDSGGQTSACALGMALIAHGVEADSSYDADEFTDGRLLSKLGAEASCVDPTMNFAAFQRYPGLIGHRDPDTTLVGIVSGLNDCVDLTPSQIADFLAEFGH